MDWIYYIQGYPLVVITTMIEGAAIPFPGGFILAWLGFVIGWNPSRLAVATGLGVLGYMLGSIIPYLLGRFGGRQVIQNVCRRFHLATGNIQLAEKWFNKYGLIFVALSRPFFLGNYISFVAGMAHTKPVPFMLCTALGIFPWVFIYLYLGMILGKHWRQAVELVSQYSFLSMIVVLLIVLVFLFRGRLQQLSR